jgi:hypothetical protein
MHFFVDIFENQCINSLNRSKLTRNYPSMKPTNASVSKHMQAQPSYRFTVRCEELNIMNMRGYDS